MAVSIFIALMTSNFSQDFREYYVTDRPTTGLTTTGAARTIINNHTITY